LRYCRQAGLSAFRRRFESSADGYLDYNRYSPELQNQFIPELCKIAGLAEKNECRLAKETTQSRQILKLGFLSTAVSPFAVHSFAQIPKRDERPNILCLMGDQHRGDCIGVDGNRAIQTPNLDRIASEGAHFRCAYSSTPTCTPARAALLTGLSPWQHGMLGYDKVAERYPFEKPRAFREAAITNEHGKNYLRRSERPWIRKIPSR
jgi:hypothetical protein